MEKEHRLNLELNDEAFKLLTKIAESTGKSKTEVLRQALVLRAYLQEQKEQGKSLAVTRDNQIEKEIILT